MLLDLDRGLIRSSLRDGISIPSRLTTEQCLTVTPYPYPHRRPAFGPSRTEFVYPGYCHFDNGATREIDDVLLENGGLPHVLPLAIHIKYLGSQVEGTKFCCGAPPSFLKV